ncbi:hypothetical protein [Streptomyces sp. V2I9]|uniref:hypothetical protein n=1 Tax=Streptomyces sp. V2I9 TaxID=3042304 RepID=UPI00277D9F61|nr:hypothetical protein [Streptomyces sp. V2I9]MDQ0983098.1 hypothetical protein [Streptomyces sp. V2I9]
MAAVIAVLEDLGDLVPLTAHGAAARFSARGWAPGGRPRHDVETSWDEDGAGGWSQTFEDGTVRVSFAVEVRDVDASGYFDDLDAVYEQPEPSRTGQRWRNRPGFDAEDVHPSPRYPTPAGRGSAGRRRKQWPSGPHPDAASTPDVVRDRAQSAPTSCTETRMVATELSAASGTSIPASTPVRR